MEPNNPNDGYEPLPNNHPPHHHVGYHHPPPPPQQQPPHGGISGHEQHPHAAHHQQQQQAHQHQHQQQQAAYGYPPAAAQPTHHPNYTHGYAAVNYQNYANYAPAPTAPVAVAAVGHAQQPPPPVAPPLPPHHAHQQQQQHQYHAPIAHNYQVYDQAAAAAAAAAYQYPPDQNNQNNQIQVMAKAEYIHPAQYNINNPPQPPPPISITAHNVVNAPVDVNGNVDPVVEQQQQQQLQLKQQQEQEQQDVIAAAVGTSVYDPPEDDADPAQQLQQMEVVQQHQHPHPHNQVEQVQVQIHHQMDAAIQDHEHERVMVQMKMADPAQLPATEAEADNAVVTNVENAKAELTRPPEDAVVLPAVDPAVAVERTGAEEMVVDGALPTTDGTSDAAAAENEGEQSAKTMDTIMNEQSTASDDINGDARRTFSFGTALALLENYRNEHGNATISASHPAFLQIVDALVFGGIEDEADIAWEKKFAKLKEYKERNRGDCDVPFTDASLGDWVMQQRELYKKHGGGGESSESSSDDGQTKQTTQQTKSVSNGNKNKRNNRYTTRFEKLASLDFDFQTPMWDIRFRELMEYQKQHLHCSPPVTYPKLGIWVVNQRFNIKDMPRERAAALDSIRFVWNHNRKNRSQAAWDKKYEELLEYIKQNNHCNVPATFRHSPLGTWVGKQREEYKKMKDKKSSQLDKYRVDKLNEVNFQWSLQSWTIISWNDRFESLKKFKERNGHCKVPRNHPDFGNWPVYQKAQYKLFKEGKKSKITKAKVDKLLDIGFFEVVDPHMPPQLAAGMTMTSDQRGGYEAASYEWNHQTV